MTAPRLELVNPEELRHTWLAVRDRVQALSDKANEPWIADDVFHELIVGNVYLWATPDLDAFSVVSIHAAAYTRDLHIWIACENTEAKAPEYWPQFVEMARENKCSRIFFDSERKGWKRAMPELRAVTRFYCEV